MKRRDRRAKARYAAAIGGDAGTLPLDRGRRRGDGEASDGARGDVDEAFLAGYREGLADGVALALAGAPKPKPRPALGTGQEVPSASRTPEPGAKRPGARWRLLAY